MSALSKHKRRFKVVSQVFPPFFKVAFSRQGLGCSDGRTLIWGKIRRSFITQFPGWAEHLQKKYGLSGECVSCGASCNLLFQCPHWNKRTRLCSVYEDRPNICRHFPMTPQDIKDRALVQNGKKCGFSFSKTTH